MTQRDYTWSSIFAWGLTLSGATLATGGVIGMFWPQLDIGWLCITYLGTPLPITLLAVVAGCGLLGMAIERVGLRPLQGSPRIAPLARLQAMWASASGDPPGALPDAVSAAGRSSSRARRSLSTTAPP